jgi:glutamyl-tRNA synthetase
MSHPARVRFAPSPTGHLHVGSIRSGLFNWLWARHTGGVFVLRIEDTDRARLVEGAIDQINDSLEALGIAPDEGPRQGGKYGPYLQSERLDIYKSHADKLLESGALYPCWCTSERLDALRTAAQKAGTAFKYDRHCLSPANQLTEADPHVLRFKIPETPALIGWDDAVRGHMEFKTTELDDFVAIKSDGYPTYHFANVVDDHLMEISHVLRADEWLPSTPKHLLLFAAFGWDEPIYAHLPPVQGPDGKKKLSKRDGAQSVGEYVAAGYLPESLMSFLASLGWNDGTTQEIYSPEELVQKFTLERIQKSPAMFDLERLTWINGRLIREMPLESLLERSEAFWPPDASRFTPEYRLQALGLVQERLKFLAELPELTDFFFTDPDYADSVLAAEAHSTRYGSPSFTELLDKAYIVLEKSDFSLEQLETWLRQLAVDLDVKPGTLFSAIRVATTGKKAAPGLFETLHVLGSEICLKRLQAASNLLNR